MGVRFTPQICRGLFFSIGALSLSAADPSPSTPFLQVDFGTKTSPVQAGFLAAKASVGHQEGPFTYEFSGYKTDVTASGSITVTIAGGSKLASTEKLCARDRQEALPKGAAGVGDLYRDFLTGPSSLTVGISGLKPETTCIVTVYCFDKNRPLSMEVADYSNGSRGAVVLIIPAGKQIVNGAVVGGEKSAPVQAKVSDSGQLVFRITSLEGGSAAINALSISAK
jgi:hypothetical protein